MVRVSPRGETTTPAAGPNTWSIGLHFLVAFATAGDTPAVSRSGLWRVRSGAASAHRALRGLRVITFRDGHLPRSCGVDADAARGDRGHAAVPRRASGEPVGRTRRVARRENRTRSGPRNRRRYVRRSAARDRLH